MEQVGAEARDRDDARGSKLLYAFGITAYLLNGILRMIRVANIQLICRPKDVILQRVEFTPSRIISVSLSPAHPLLAPIPC